MSARFGLLLAGAGHAHLGVLRRWAEPSARHNRPTGRIGLLSADGHAWYSGMLPGLLSGRYQLAECRIELDALCRAAGVELLIGQATGLDSASQQLQLSDGRALGYNYLSLNLGSLPALPAQSGCGLELLAVKPFSAFIQGWQRWQSTPQPLAILGGGAAGVELALAIAAKVPTVTLLTGSTLLSEHPPALRRRALKHLARRGVRVQEHCPVEAIVYEQLLSHGRSVWQGHRLIVASGASALPWLADSGLACDAQGFVQINAQLQSTSHNNVFAVGDCASLAHCPHNGVYAVRQGPVLAQNLAALLCGRPLQAFQPQRRALALLATGDGGALASWAGLTGEGSLLGHWKDHLDRGFMQRHRIP
jgi:pyridine nucleotide-disulfide oxidoreductase family protein